MQKCLPMHSLVAASTWYPILQIRRCFFHHWGLDGSVKYSLCQRLYHFYLLLMY